MESQPYLRGPDPVRLSDRLRIQDDDNGEQNLTEAQVRITDGMQREPVFQNTWLACFD